MRTVIVLAVALLACGDNTRVTPKDDAAVADAAPDGVLKACLDQPTALPRPPRVSSHATWCRRGSGNEGGARPRLARRMWWRQLAGGRRAAADRLRSERAGCDAAREIIMETQSLMPGELVEGIMTGGPSDSAFIQLMAPTATVGWNIHGHEMGAPRSPRGVRQS